VRFLELSPLAAPLVLRLMRGEPLGVAATGSLAELGLARDDPTLSEVAVLLEGLARSGPLLST
jgi:hypothetical protein